MSSEPFALPAVRLLIEEAPETKPKWMMPYLGLWPDFLCFHATLISCLVFAVLALRARQAACLLTFPVMIAACYLAVKGERWRILSHPAVAASPDAVPQIPDLPGDNVFLTDAGVDYGDGTVLGWNHLTGFRLEEKGGSLCLTLEQRQTPPEPKSDDRAFFAGCRAAAIVGWGGVLWGWSRFGWRYDVRSVLVPVLALTWLMALERLEAAKPARSKRFILAFDSHRVPREMVLSLVETHLSPLP